MLVYNDLFVNLPVAIVEPNFKASPFSTVILFFHLNLYSLQTAIESKKT